MSEVGYRLLVGCDWVCESEYGFVNRIFNISCNEIRSRKKVIGVEYMCMAANTALTCWGMVSRLLEVSCGVWRLCSGSFVFSWLGVWSSMDQTSSNVPQMLYRKKDLGNLEAGSTIWALWNVSQSNPEKFLVMCQGTLSPWRKHCHQGGPLPEGVHLVVWVGGVCLDQRILFQKFDHMWPTFIAWSSLFFPHGLARRQVLLLFLSAASNLASAAEAPLWAFINHLELETLQRSNNNRETLGERQRWRDGRIRKDTGSQRKGDRLRGNGKEGRKKDSLRMDERLGEIKRETETQTHPE